MPHFSVCKSKLKSESKDTSLKFHEKKRKKENVVQCFAQNILYILHYINIIPHSKEKVIA